MPQTRQARIEFLIVAGLFLLALFSLGRIASKLADPAFGGLDFHSFWYSGHVLRQRENPHRFVLDHRKPDLPVSYIDGPITTKPPVAVPGFATWPINTAPVYLPLAASAFFSWPAAKWIWSIINLALMLLIPYLIIKLFPYGRWFSSLDKLLIALLFFSLTSTRVGAWIGQTTFLIFALMLGSLLLRERNEILAGVLLGFALSKYSLAIAVVLFLIWEWRRRNLLMLGVAAIVQAGALLVLSWISRVTPWAILSDYWEIFWIFLSRDQGGLKLGILFPDSTFFAIAVPLVLTGCVFGLLLWLRSKHRWPEAASELVNYEAVSVFTLWSLVVAYHRIYDLSLAIIVAPLGLLLFHQVSVWHMAKRQRNGVLALLTAGFAILIMPGTIVMVFLPHDLANSWLLLSDRLLMLAVLALLCATLWLMTRPHQEAKATIAPEGTSGPILSSG